MTKAAREQIRRERVKLRKFVQYRRLGWHPAAAAAKAAKEAAK